MPHLCASLVDRLGPPLSLQKESVNNAAGGHGSLMCAACQMTLTSVTAFSYAVILAACFTH